MANGRSLSPTVFVRVLGGLEIELQEERIALPPGKPRSLFAWLALHPGLHPRRELAGRFWPDVLDSSSRASLRSALWALRSALGPAACHLRITREDVGLAEEVRTDLAEFQRLVEAGERVAAIGLCRGRLLNDLDVEWVFEAREEHERRVAVVLAQLADEAEAGGNQATAVDWTRRRLALEPLSEDAARDLMRMLAAAGDRAGSLAAYNKLRERFRTQLGVSPSEQTRTLARALGRGEIGPAQDPAVGAGTVQLAHALPFTGRAEELEALVDAWREARRACGRLAVVTGEAGIGKTRLAAELIETARADGARVASCAALDLGGGAPFGLWAELLRDLLRACGAPPEDVPWTADLARLSPELEGALAPAPPVLASPSPELERARLFEAMVGMVEWTARQRPCVLLFEDVHAADLASLELLGYVARRLPRLAVLIVLTRRDLPRRPEVDHVLQRLAQRGTGVREIELGPLPPDDIGRLLRAAEDLEPEQVERVVATAEGNPFLAVETAHAIAAGREQPAESLRATVRAAATRLDGQAKLLAGLVSVAAREMDRAEVERLPIEDPSGAAAAAIEAGLLVSRSGRLGYRHALLREAIYADFSEPQRAQLHARFASVLVAEGSSRRAAEAARHLLLAGRDEAAVEQLERAAQDARSVAAYAEAAGFLEEAVRIASHNAPLLEELAEVEAWRGRREAAIAAFGRAEPLLAKTDAATQARAWIRRGRWLRGALCYPSESRLAYLRGLELIDAAGDGSPKAQTEALAGLAWAEAVAGEIERAEELLNRLDRVGEVDRVAELDRELARGHLLIRRGRFADTYSPLSRAATLAVELRRPDLAYSGLINASSAAACAGDFERSLAFADRCRAMMREAGLVPLEANALAARAHILTRLGRLEEARASAAAEAELADQLDDPRLAAMADHDRGMVCHAAGDHETAARAPCARRCKEIRP